VNATFLESAYCVIGATREPLLQVATSIRAACPALQAQTTYAGELGSAGAGTVDASFTLRETSPGVFTLRAETEPFDTNACGQALPVPALSGTFAISVAPDMLRAGASRRIDVAGYGGVATLELRAREVDGMPCADAFLRIDPDMPLCGTMDFAGTLCTRVSCAADPADSDADEVPDDVDNCPERSNRSQGDQDNDGDGDECDSDRDGDGCRNEGDDDPDDSTIVTGTLRFSTCDTVIEVLGFAGDDHDGDGTPSCADLDDDNDGVLDGSDTCPVEGPTDSCHRTTTVPCGKDFRALQRVEKCVGPGCSIGDTHSMLIDPSDTLQWRMGGAESDAAGAPNRTPISADMPRAAKGSAAGM
jgi:hypothetical protein